MTSAHHPAWKWAVCLMLLMATMLNYMDRLTVAQLSKDIIAEFELSETEYGSIDAVFSVAFAVGALLVGWMVDRWNVWWIYPTAVAAWSAAGADGAGPGEGVRRPANVPVFPGLYGGRALAVRLADHATHPASRAAYAGQ